MTTANCSCASRGDGLPAMLLAKMGQTHVHRDAVHPRPEPRTAIEGVNPGENLNERILGEVGSTVTVADHPQAEPEDAVLVSSDEVRHRRPLHIGIVRSQTVENGEVFVVGIVGRGESRSSGRSSRSGGIWIIGFCRVGGVRRGRVRARQRNRAISTVDLRRFGIAAVSDAIIS